MLTRPALRFRTVVLDAVDPDLVGRFWLAALGADLLRIERVCEAKRVKHRMHLDIDCERLTDLEALGARVVLPEADDRHWTVMADPEGGEFCAFLRTPPRDPRLHGVVLDCADPVAQGRFWHRLLGGTLDEHGGAGWATIEGVLPGCTFDFVPVPEPKRGPNRIHLEFDAESVAALVELGARVLSSPPGDRPEDIAWQLLADPEGNEFRVFPGPSDSGP